MFGQVVQGRTSDPAGVKRVVERWVRDVSPGAVGWLGTTAGVTQDGEFVAVFRFDSEEAAGANSARRNQDQWWSDTNALFGDEITVRNGQRTEVFTTGDLSQAGFVQVVQGRVSDFARAREHLSALQEALRTHLPALLGTVTVELEAGHFTRVLYFSTEDAARASERERPPEIRERDQEALQWIVGRLTFFDLREPWCYAAR